MKNILVPTDFSECASFAVDAAAMFAKRFQANVHVLNSQDLPPYWDHLPNQEKEKWSQVTKSFEKAEMALEALKKKYADVAINTCTTSRPLPKAISWYTEKHGIDLIVIGSHGSSGKNETRKQLKRLEHFRSLRRVF